jgi:hypothetical protein
VPVIYFLDETADIGRDTASPVSDDHTAADSAFSGTIAWVRIDLEAITGGPGPGYAWGPVPRHAGTSVARPPYIAAQARAGYAPSTPKPRDRAAWPRRTS